MESTGNNIFECFKRCFATVCGFLTTIIVCACISVYILNEDVSRVDFHLFHSHFQDQYPTTTLCFYNPFLENELKKYGDGINTTTYSQFLQGKFADDRMRDIDYDNVTVSLNDFLLGAGLTLH